MSAVMVESKGFGATQEEWTHFSDVLGLTEDLVSLVSNPSIPISPTSQITEKSRSKAPSEVRRGMLGGIQGWQDKRSTRDDVDRWARHPDHNICIVTRNVRAIDIDIDDEQAAAAAVDAIEMSFGTFPKRVRAGNGRCLLAFRLAGEHEKQTIATPNGAIEFLATGQQFVAVGTHKSGARYEWEGGLPTAIPELRPEEFSVLWAALAGAVGVADGGPVGARKTVARVGEAEGAARGGGVVNADGTLPEWREVLLHEKYRTPREHGPGREMWRDTVFAVHHESGGSAEGYEIVLAWCHADNEDGFWGTDAEVTEALNVAWNSAGSDRPTVTTGGAILRYARAMVPIRPLEALEDGDEHVVHDVVRVLPGGRLEHETDREHAARIERARSTAIGRDGRRSMPTQRLMTGSEIMDEFVYLAEGAQVAFLSEPRFVLPLPEMKNWLAGSVEKIADTKRTAHRLDAWMRSPERKSVRTRTFAPGRGIVCDDPKGASALNLWRPRADVVPINWEALAEPFFDHVAYLVPDKSERDRFLDWLAHIEQDPGVLPHTHYLMVAKQTGIGRNWLAYALARCFAGYTALGFNLAGCLDKGFNDELSQSLLAVVDELHEGGPGGASRHGAERLKSMLTESTRMINPKFGRRHVEFNSCRFLMFSNHEAALPLAENDRRVVVIENPTDRRGEGRYAQLYALLDAPGFGAALAEAFRRRDIRGFNPGSVAPMNAAKGRTIRAGRSEVEAAVRDVAAEWPSACISSKRLLDTVAEALGVRTWSPQGACVAAGIKKYEGLVPVEGTSRRTRVWILRDVDRWMQAGKNAVAAEVRRGEIDALEDDDVLW